MAYGNVVLLELDFTTLLKYCVFDDSSSADDVLAEEENDVYVLLDYVDTEIQKELSRAHFDVVKRLIDPQVYDVAGKYGRTERILGSHKNRLISPFSIGVFDDEETHRFGIALTSRYVPTFIDWEHAHGASHLPVVVDEDFLRMVDEAKKVIGEIVGEVKNVAPSVVLTHF